MGTLRDPESYTVTHQFEDSNKVLQDEKSVEATSTEKILQMETDVPEVSDDDQYGLCKAAVRDRPTDYEAHLSLVGYLRRRKPASLDLLKARRE